MAPRVVDKTEKRRALVEAAARVFAERGFAGATMADVAEAADVGKGTLYEYFETKDSLFFAVFETFVADIDQRLQGIADAEGPAEERLRRMVRGAVNVIVERLDGYGLTMEFWAASTAGPAADRLAEMFRDSYRRLRRLVADVVHDGQAGGEFDPGVDGEALATGLVGALDALGLQMWFDRTIDPHRIADGFVDVLILGVRPR